MEPRPLQGCTEIVKTSTTAREADWAVVSRAPLKSIIAAGRVGGWPPAPEAPVKRTRVPIAIGNSRLDIVMCITRFVNPQELPSRRPGVIRRGVTLAL